MGDEQIFSIISEDLKYIKQKVDGISNTMGKHETRLTTLENIARSNEEIRKMHKALRQFVVISSIALGTLLTSILFHLLPYLW
ncbi:MAG: hypothetical protein ACYDAO_04255 [Thermoplasmataceae archaeon]